MNDMASGLACRIHESLSIDSGWSIDNGQNPKVNYQKLQRSNHLYLALSTILPRPFHYPLQIIPLLLT